jgi:hypothetical protein
MSANWITITSIATAASAVIACGSLWSVYALYKITKRDERTRRVRDAIVSARTLALQLNSMVDTGMGFEAAESVAVAAQMQHFLCSIHKTCFAAGQNKTPEELKTLLKEITPTIVTPVRSTIADKFKDGLAVLERLQSEIRYDHPGLSRVIKACSIVLNNTIRAQQHLVRDEKAWGQAITQLHTGRKPVFEEYEAFHNELIEMFVGTWVEIMMQVNQPNIDDTIAALSLVVDCYLEKSPRALLRLSKYERSKKMIPDDKTKTVGDDLREAEKCLDRSLSQQDLLLLRQYSVQMEARSKVAKQKGE